MVYCGKPSKGCSNCRERKIRVSWPSACLAGTAAESLLLTDMTRLAVRSEDAHLWSVREA